MKHSRRVVLLVLPAALWACTSQELLFEPSCIAFEGDRVTLRGNDFEWRKFSDQVPMGAVGARANPHPDYPMSGTYRLENDRVEFKPRNGAKIGDHYMLDHRGARYLLTADEHQEFSADGQLPNCALKLVTVE